MKKHATSTRIYLAAQESDSVIQTNTKQPGLKRSGTVAVGKTHGLISFCIPDYGVLFRCRILSSQTDLLLTTAITALRFVERSFPTGSEPKVILCTHLPAAYYALTHESKRKSEDPLGAYRKKYSLEVNLIARQNNQALAPAMALPSHPLDTTPALKLKKSLQENSCKMAPLQDGIEL